MQRMTADGVSGAAWAGIKFGLLSLLVTVVAVVLGFTVVPLTPGAEMRDAARRLCAGILSAFIFGPACASWVFETFPGYVGTFARIVGSDDMPMAYVLAAMPAMALCSLVGFWLVAAVMRFFTRRRQKDIAQIAKDVITFCRDLRGRGG